VGLISQFMVRSFWYGEGWGAYDVIGRGGALCPFEEPVFYVCLFLCSLELM